MPRRRRNWERQACYHITHRCHNREFRFRHEKYRRMYRRYLFEATRLFRFRVLTWIVTSNHVHVLATGTERGAPQISEALQHVHGELAQHYNLERKCDGSFWSNRFHATRIQSGRHLARCMFYVDLNMVRAGVVSHPCEWDYGTWPELSGARRRYRIVDREVLLNRLEVGPWESFVSWYRQTIDAMVTDKTRLRRQPHWSTAVAVGDAEWLEQHACGLGMRRFEIREAMSPGPQEDADVRTFFLG